jgi:hypothetical protein
VGGEKAGSVEEDEAGMGRWMGSGKVAWRDCRGFMSPPHPVKLMTLLPVNSTRVYAVYPLTPLLSPSTTLFSHPNPVNCTSSSNVWKVTSTNSRNLEEVDL